MIQDHNKQADLGKYTYWLGMNHFGDLTNEELGKRLHCLLSDNVSKVKGIPFKSSENPDIPDHMDWRIKGGVTKVKDQGGCGSCWSFSATGALEGMHFKKTGKLVSLSEQNLIDCSGDPEFKGCQGSLMENAFETVRKRGGINSEKSYPYDRTDGMPCRYKPEESITRCSSYGEITSEDEKSLQEAVARIGPVSVGIDAGSSKFGFYKSGIYKEQHGGERQISHAMLIVGYNNTSEGKGYWILKNRSVFQLGLKTILLKYLEMVGVVVQLIPRTLAEEGDLRVASPENRMGSFFLPGALRYLNSVLAFCKDGQGTHNIRRSASAL
ncbi:PREDICTED: cathepsin L1-like [Thamnophis sirtalis]|uniref:Cathepsin L1-like n=1 Tax=Thamnophis sirtalis TaxID=35019 RepID=A0A6I9Y5J2_9SAUR|nr:PREDICTED: cathepsin L1-like [Thamnophis sirtalis]